MRINRVHAVTGAVAWLVAASPAYADSPCDAGYRDTTTTERAQITRVLETIRSAMPAPAAGWVIGGDETLSVPQSLCQDFKLVPLPYSFSRLYRNAADSERQMKLINDQAAVEAAAFEKKKPRLEAIQAQMEKVVAQQVAVMQKGDMAGAQKFNAEIERLQNEYQKIADEGSDPKAMEAAGKAANRDMELSISVHVNPMTARTPTEAKPVTAPTGAKYAHRWHVEDENQSVDHALYYFGSWFRRPDGTFQPAPPPGAPLSAAHGLTIEIIGDPARVTQAVSTTDFAKLAAIAK